MDLLYWLISIALLLLILAFATAFYFMLRLLISVKKLLESEPEPETTKQQQAIEEFRSNFRLDGRPRRKLRPTTLWKPASKRRRENRPEA